MRQLEVDSRNHKYYSEMIEIYREAFPPAECFPEEGRTLVREGRGSALVYEDTIGGEDRFVGAIYIVKDDVNVMALFLAISKSVRGHGYGSRILGQLAEEYPDHKISLQIETTREPARDIENRRRRAAFYRKNGFEFAPIVTSEPGGIFDFMVYGGMVDIEEMREFMTAVIGVDLLKKWRVELRSL